MWRLGCELWVRRDSQVCRSLKTTVSDSVAIASPDSPHSSPCGLPLPGHLR